MKLLASSLLPLGFFMVGVQLSAEGEHGTFRFPPPLTAPVATVLGLRLAAAPLLLLGIAAAAVSVPEAYHLQAAMPCGDQRAHRRPRLRARPAAHVVGDRVDDRDLRCGGRDHRSVPVETARMKLYTCGQKGNGPAAMHPCAQGGQRAEGCRPRLRDRNGARLQAPVLDTDAGTPATRSRGSPGRPTCRCSCLTTARSSTGRAPSPAGPRSTPRGEGARAARVPCGGARGR